MSVTKKTYTIGSIKQLIDLNGDSTNFDLTFKVTCRDSTPFNLLVVDQHTLDNSPELKYKDAKGSISGNIIADKNMYQNYYLILKSDKTCQVDVEINKKELPKTPEHLLHPDMGAPPPQRFNNGGYTDKINWKVLLLIGVGVGGLIILYFLYNRKPSLSQDKDHAFGGGKDYTAEPYFMSRSFPPKERKSPVLESSGHSLEPSSSHRSESHRSESHRSEGGYGGNSTLLDKLNKLHMK